MNAEEDRMIPISPQTPLTELARAAAKLGLRPVQRQGRLYLTRIQTRTVRPSIPLHSHRRKP